jgi:hypothetical protein
LEQLGLRFVWTFVFPDAVVAVVALGSLGLMISSFVHLWKEVWKKEGRLMKEEGMGQELEQQGLQGRRKKGHS